MEVKFNFDLNAWIDNLTIEANSVEEAKEKLLKMNFEEVVENGSIKLFDVKNVSYTVSSVEKTYNVEVVGLEPASFEYSSEEEKEELIKKVIGKKTIITVLDNDTNVFTANDKENVNNELECKLGTCGTYHWTWSYKGCC